MKSYDVAVVGAGPAGITAADSASKSGRKVILFDRKKDIGYPVRCGEGVGFKGMNASIGIREEWVLSKIKRVRMISPSGHKVDLEKIGKSCIIDRVKMERDLAQEAVSKGVELNKSTSIERVVYKNGKYILSTSDKTFSSDYVVLSDGVESRIARQLGWDTALKKEDLETCAVCRVESETIDPEMIEFHIGHAKAPGGYAWVMPRGDGSANVGLGILGSYSKIKVLLSSAFKTIS